MKKSILLKELLLVLTTVIWGFGFIAQSIGGEILDPYTFNVARNIVASIFLFFVCLVSRKIYQKRGTYHKEERPKERIIGGTLIGLSLAAAMMFQQIGINSEGAGKSGFLTALYIVFVPVFSIFLTKKLNPLVGIAIVLGTTGLYLINITDGDFHFGVGAIMLLLCAICYSIQILLISYYSPRHDAFELSFIQFTVAMIVLLPFAVFLGSFTFEKLLAALPAILFLGIGSSGVAYTLQMYAQSEVNVTVASIIMSLESVFSLIFGMIFLQEKHGLLQILGCLSIFAAVIIAQLPTPKRKGESK